MDASLAGRVETVGILELLRIPLNTKRSGTLIVVSADPDASDAEARFHYLEGKLVGAALGARSGQEALRGVLSWAEGEFEFSAGSEPPSAIDEKLHGALVHELKAWYAKRVGKVGAASEQTSSAATESTEHAHVAAAGARGGRPAPALVPPRPAQQSTVKDLAAYREAQKSSSPPAIEALRPNVLGAGKIDGKGVVTEHVGQFSGKEGALSFAVLQIAATIGKELGFGAVRSVQVKGKGERWLALEVRGAATVGVVCKPDSDLLEELSNRAQ